MFPMTKFHEIWPCLGYPPFWDKPIFLKWLPVKEFSGVWRAGRPEGPFGHCTTPLCFRGEKMGQTTPWHHHGKIRKTSPLVKNNSVSLTINIQQYHFHHIHIMTHHENHLKSDWNNPVLVHRLDPQATFSRPLSILLWHAPTDPSPAFGGKTRWIGPSIPEEFHNGRVVQLNSYFDGKNRAHLDAAGLEAPGAENILKAMTFQEGHHQLLVAVSHAWWLGRPIRPIDRFEDERGRWNRENEEKKTPQTRIKNGSHLKFLEPRRLRNWGLSTQLWRT